MNLFGTDNDERVTVEVSNASPELHIEETIQLTGECHRDIYIEFEEGNTVFRLEFDSAKEIDYFEMLIGIAKKEMSV